MNPREKGCDRQKLFHPKLIHPTDVVPPEFRVLSSTERGWRGIIVHRNIEPPSEMNVPPTSHHYISLFTSLVNVGKQARQISRFADLSFEGEARAGAMFVIPAAVPSFFSWVTVDHTITIAVEPDYLRETAEKSFGMNPHRVELLGHTNLYDANIERLAHLLNEELEMNEANNSLYADSLSTALAVHLLRTRCAFAPLEREYKGGLSKFQLRQIVDYINDNLSNNFKLFELAAVVQMSEYHFAKQFKRTTGLAPHQYVIRCRVERAKSLLRQTDLPISETALQLGFHDQSHFTNLFRRWVGVTPKAFRAKL